MPNIKKNLDSLVGKKAKRSQIFVRSMNRTQYWKTLKKKICSRKPVLTWNYIKHWKLIKLNYHFHWMRSQKCIKVVY